MSDEILRLADQTMYVQSAEQGRRPPTLPCPAGGVTYIPVPRGQGANLAGLLTVDFPDTVKKGQVHTVSVRQVTSAAGVVRRPVRPEDTAPPRGRSRRRSSALEAEDPA